MPKIKAMMMMMMMMTTAAIIAHTSHSHSQGLLCFMLIRFQHAGSVAPASPLRLVALLGRSRANLDGGDYKCLIVGMGASAFAAQHATD